jgi:hypothetical protein
MTDAEVEAVLDDMPKDEAEAIRLMRKQLRAHGVTREPMLTRMACEFAEVLLQGRQAK